jgi:hypothetical protein
MVHLMELSAQASALRSLPLGNVEARQGGFTEWTLRCQKNEWTWCGKLKTFSAPAVMKTQWPHSTVHWWVNAFYIASGVNTAVTAGGRGGGVWKYVHKIQSSASNCGFLSRPPVWYTSVLPNYLSRTYVTFSKHWNRKPIRLVQQKAIGGAKRKSVAGCSKCSWVKCSEVLQCSGVFCFFFYRFVYGCRFCILLFNSVSYIFLLLCLCILTDNYALFCILFANWHSPTTVTEVFPCFFLSCNANARVYLAKT